MEKSSLNGLKKGELSMETSLRVLVPIAERCRDTQEADAYNDALVHVMDRLGKIVGRSSQDIVLCFDGGVLTDMHGLIRLETRSEKPKIQWKISLAEEIVEQVGGT